MSLSRRERWLLDRADAALRRTDPDLAIKFAIFRQGADGEPVPGHEQLPPGPGWPDWVRAALARLAVRHQHSAAAAAVPRHCPSPAARPAHPGHGRPGRDQEDPMSAIFRMSPLPPDRADGAHSPLPPDPAPDRRASPLPPDPGQPAGPPVPRPRPAPDDQADGTGQDGAARRRPDGPR